jgi:hypothetical protein
MMAARLGGGRLRGNKGYADLIRKLWIVCLLSWRVRALGGFDQKYGELYILTRQALRKCLKSKR